MNLPSIMAEGKEANRVRNILLLADSRGRGMEVILNDNKLGFIFHVVSEPGANLRTLTNKLLKMCDTGSVIQFEAVFIFAGICNATKIMYVPNRVAVPRYSTDSEILGAFKSECQHLFWAIENEVHVPVILSPIVGIDMWAYARGPLQAETSDILFKQQPIVDSAVVMINNLDGMNDEKGLPSPNILYTQV